MSINYIALGQSGLQVSPLSFGGNVFGWTAGQAETLALLDAWTGEGFNFIDTADVYSRWVDGNAGGESETLLGNWLHQSGKREQVVIATKVGMDLGDGKKGLRPEYIRQAVDASLQRLKTDYIDLYYAHLDDQDTPLDETLGAFDALVKEGKVRAIGASNYSAERLQQALEISARHNLARYEVLQPYYNLYDREEFETSLLPVVTQNNLGVCSYYSLASGFLSGKYRLPEDASKSARGQGVVQRYLNSRGLLILEKLDAVAKRYETSLTSVVLAWTLARPGITSPIVSASTAAQLPELFEAVRLELDADALEELNLATDIHPEQHS